MDDDIVDAVEPAAMVVIQNNACGVWSIGTHVDQATWVCKGALGAEQDAIFVVNTAISHLDAGDVQGLASPLPRR